MPTFAQCLDLVDEPARIAEYRRLHERIWPEGFDPARDYQGYAAQPRVREWDELMRTFQRRVPAARDGEWWSAMECVFDLDTQA